MKKTLKSIVLLGALCGGSLHTSFEFRSPSDFINNRGYNHALLKPADQAFWYDMMPSEKKHTEWNMHFWGLAYTRFANKAFAKHETCPGACPQVFCRNKVTRDTGSLSQLFFGQEVFLGEQSFAGGTFAGAPSVTQELVNGINPFLAFARIAPNLSYDERGANMGIDFARYVGRDDRWHVGGRISIPFKIIEVQQDGTIEETLQDVVVTRIITAGVNGTPNNLDYAYRFDFLNSLVFASSLVPLTPVPVVRYNTTGADAGTIDITGQRVTGTSASVNIQTPPAYVVKSNCGTLPAVPFRKAASEVVGALPASGQGDEGSAYFFQTGVDYANNLRNDRLAQSQLFLVPRAVVPGGDIGNNAAQIQQNITALINADLLISEPASAFFLNNGIDIFGDERVVGIGDLATEFYFGRGDYDNWFVDGIIGILFPTGKKQPSSNRVYYKPTGNNGHVELKLEIDGQWKPRPWFAFEIRPAFSHAFRRTEKRAAPFEGATVINLGPEIEADVSWSYFVLRTDFSIFHPHNPDLGFMFGYELFVKGHDHVSINCQQTATNLLGQPDQVLAACNYEKNTNSLTNKLRGEIFYRCHYFEIFGGGSRIVSGRNAMKETQGHIGLAIYF